MRTMQILIVTLALTSLVAPMLRACTVFVLTDGERTLFCNNEDWSNPKTRIWFVPGGKGYYGCAYVGFDNGWGQGGLNTKGLAYDWVAGFKEEWEPGTDLKTARGNPSERMLETCATVAEAVTFYRKHKEPSFSYAKILVADRTGASVVIDAKDGRLQIQEARENRGFGYGRQQLRQLLTKTPEPTAASGARILRACLQKGKYATKYANVFDLKTSDIFVLPFPGRDDKVKLNLMDELAKGGHYYDIPRIREQLTEAPLPLRNNMKRLLLDQFKPIPDPEPHVAQRLRLLIQNAMAGKMQSRDYAAPLWQELAGAREEIQAELTRLGGLVSLTLVERDCRDGQRSYRYLARFKSARALLHLILDGQSKVAYLQSEASEVTPVEN